MKKNILSVLFVYFSFMGMSNAAMPSVSACTVSSGVTTFPTSSNSFCSAQPDVYKLTVYEMKLCTAAITAPTTSSAVGTTTCQAVLTNTSPSATTITKGGSSAVAGTITRPPNGTYTHGYMLVSNALTVSDSRYFDESLDIDADNSADGRYCATTSSSMNCSDSDNLTAAEQTMKLGSTHLTGYVSGDTAITGYGTMNAYLIDTDKKLEADTDSDVVYLAGQLAFTTPVVISDNTKTFNMSFDVSNGIMYMNQNNATKRAAAYVGPFMVRMSVE